MKSKLCKCRVRVIVARWQKRRLKRYYKPALFLGSVIGAYGNHALFTLSVAWDGIYHLRAQTVALGAYFSAGKAKFPVAFGSFGQVI